MVTTRCDRLIAGGKGVVTRFGRSVRARLTLFASVAMALLCVVVSAFALHAVHTTAVGRRTNEVLTAALRVVHLVKRHELPPVISGEVDGIQVVDSAGRVVSTTENLTGRPRMSQWTPDADNANRTRVVCDLPDFPGRCEILTVLRVYERGGDWLVYAAAATVPRYVHPAVLGFLGGDSLALVVLTWFGVSRVVARTLTPVDRLERAAERQRRFVADVSHDLRSPITAMRAEVEEAMLYPGDADWQRTGVALLGSLDRLQAIVDDLLTLAQLDAGAPAVREPVDLAELVGAETARRRSKPVITTLRPGVTVLGDPVRLARLLTNLLDNAERHAESQVAVTVRHHDGAAVLEVADDGAGIAPDQREVVFQRFTRLSAARERDACGTGLGLAIAREIALAHGGTLTLEDSDRGARFVVRLPRFPIVEG